MTESTPFHSTRPGDSTRPRLLLVSYNFPPRQTAGALRWRKLSWHLHDAGWDIDVLTTPPTTAVGDGLSDLPPGVALYSVPEYPGYLRRFEDALASRLRGGSGTAAPAPSTLPHERATSEARPWITTDALRWFPRRPRDLIRIYKILVEHEELLAWARDAVEVGRGLMARHGYGAVLASGPPWSTPMAGARLAREGSLPLIQDFRDPWGLPQPGLMEKTAHPLGPVLASRLEADVVRHATTVIVNTPTVERAMAEQYPWVPFRTILNGVDDVFADSGARSGEPFRIVYAGTIYLDRDPNVIFRPVGDLVRRLGLTPDELTVEFVGNATHYHGSPVADLAAEAGLGDHFTLHPSMPRARLLDFLKTAAVLVSLPQSTPWSTPSKIYEYMGFNAWLLVYAEPGSSTAEILEKGDAIVLAPDDRAGTTDALEACLNQFRTSGPPSGARNSDIFARRRTGEDLLALFAEMDLMADSPGTN